MEKIKKQYYERFIQHIVEEFSVKLKGAKPGHCMKITGLAMKEMRVLLPLLRAINSNVDAFILSETERGDDFIHASKLVELRNNPYRALLILVPTNCRTSAEDSYGDATFQNLSVYELQDSFIEKLIDDIPQDKEHIWHQLEELLNREVKPSRSAKINYLLYLDLNHYCDEAWGNGIYFFEMLPDKDLVKDEASLQRRFLLNFNKVSNVLGDFSATIPDRIADLPLQRNSVQKELMRFLTTEDGIEDRISLYEKIADNHEEFNYASMPWVISGDGEKVKATISINPGKDPNKELVYNSETGNYILNVHEGKKGKISFSVTTSPSPQDNPDICSFEISLVNIDDFSEVGVVKKAKVGSNKRATRKLSLNISNGMFDDGEYILRVRALDENGIVLDMINEFKEERVQSAWLDAKSRNENLQMEQFRQEQHVAYCNESDVFTIDNTGEGGGEGELNKRAKVDTFIQAIIHYRSAHLSKGEDLEIYDDGAERNQWVSRELNQTYMFDFGPAYAYQIQLSKKLVQLENTFLENSTKFGYVKAQLSGNPTDSKLLNPLVYASQSLPFVEVKGLQVPDELITMRQNLFGDIRKSVGNEGLVCTTDFSTKIGKIKEYLSEYDNWLRIQLDGDLGEDGIVSIQNLDTVALTVEMPDGSISDVKLITPLHPLRLAWIVNLYELYQDWEERTIEQPEYRKAWYRKLDKLFLGQLPMDVAPMVLSDNSMQEAYQYIGELTFGWGIFVRPNSHLEESFASGYRQLKAYTSMLLNVSRDRQIDTDVSLNLVVRHLENYVLSHPYTEKLVINLFNAGDASVFTRALVEMEKLGLGLNLSYEIRLFSEDNTLLSGEAFKDLLNPDVAGAPEAEIFSQASLNRLFPKLRFSLNNISDFIDNHDKYQAHISFLVSPFAVRTELVRPDELKRSFYLNGTICRNVVNDSKEGKAFVWNRYISNKTLPNPVSESANLEISLLARIQEATGRLLSSTKCESVPATSLRLKESDIMLLSFVHDCSDWVVTFDKNMGPEFYDLPCIGENDVPYLLDYIPGEETSGISSYLTTKPTSEIIAIMVPLFRQYDIDLEKQENFKQLLEDVRAVSSSIIMQANATQQKGFEVIGTTLAKRFLEKKGIMRESFLIPIDLHKDLFAELDNNKNERADDLVVKIDPLKGEILFTIVEIKCRNADYNAHELHEKMASQIENTLYALRCHFEMAADGCDRLDRELKTFALKSFLEFYIRRSRRYDQLSPETEQKYLQFLSRLFDGYDIRFKRLGIVFDFTQQIRQKKDYFGDAVIYTMGKPIIDDILKPNTTLDTQAIEAMDKEIVDFFEPTLPLSPSRPPVDENDEEMVYDEFGSSADNMDTPEQEFDNLDQETMSETSQKKEYDISDRISNSVREEPSEEQINYVSPVCDVVIGGNGEGRQYGVIGKVVSNGRRIALDLNECNTISLFGVQGAGKSYTIGSITEMVLRQFSNVNKLPAPMASVIFHYSESMDYAPEFTSMVYPNDEEGQLARLKNEYGAEPGNIKDVILLAPESQVEMRKAEYPDIEIHPIGFDSSELSVKGWMFLLGAVGNDSTYIKELKQIMKSCRNDMSLSNIRKGVARNERMNNSQRSLAEQKLNFAEEYINDGNKLRQYLMPGRLIIVDLRDEFIEKDEALGLFVVMLNIFSGVQGVNGRSFNKFIVFDEAHKYMNNKDLVDSITTAIREMRHKGVSVMIASQDPMSLPTEIIELSSIIVMHRFSSPAWVKHVQKAVTQLQTLTAIEMANLGSGEAYLWASKASDRAITQRPVKITIRPRLTKHGGETVRAVI